MKVIFSKMKKITYIALLILVPVGLYGQQFPFLEGYNVNPFNMSAAYAGLYNPATLFADYRTDWIGVDGGPVTYQLSYNDRIFEKVGVGGRFIYDKTDIFKQTILLGTYTYELDIATDQKLNLGLSAGIFRNSIDLARYYNSPDYVQDGVLLYGLLKSKIKFATDFSALYRFRNLEGGIVFSNVMYGSAKYNSSDIAYNPILNYLIHASYNHLINELWAVKPFVLFRGGRNYPKQIELATEVTFNKRYWATAVYRSGGVWGFGLGGKINDEILLNYSYNLSSNVALNAFGSHQVTLGISLNKPVNTVNTVNIVAPVSQVSVISQFMNVKGSLLRKADDRPATGVLSLSKDNIVIQKLAVTDGEFAFELKKGESYVIDISSEDYQPVSKNIVALNENSQITVYVDYLSVVRGRVIDRETGSEINASVAISKNYGEIQTISTTELKNIKLLQGSVYEFEFKSEGYFDKKEIVNLTTEDAVDLVVSLAKMKKETFILGPITFETGKSVLSPELLPVLDDFITYLLQNPEMIYEISGHSDNIGSLDSNNKLSIDRANACIEYIVSKGVKRSQLEAAGYGVSMPRLPNDTPENRARNRRIEVKRIG